MGPVQEITIIRLRMKRGEFIPGRINRQRKFVGSYGNSFVFLILAIRIVQNFFNKKTSSLFPTTLYGQAMWMVLLFGCSSL